MIKLQSTPAVWKNGGFVPTAADSLHAGREKTMAYKILRAHDAGNRGGTMRIKFDSLISHDITYVGVIQTARASGMERFPVPYVLTNCHNSLCAVGGTINEDDHVFGLSAAKKYGGIYVPANQAVIHQYAREALSGCGKMVLGSDSHTRYGAIGTMGVGEGGPEIVKQLLENTYDVADPEVVLVYLTGSPARGVGPHDVAIALCGATYKNGFVKNKVLEFAGPGIKNLPMDYRIGIDVMTTETACLSSIWATDERVREYLAVHGRENEYQSLAPEDGAVYDSVIEIDLSTIEPMAALPFHPSEAYTIAELRRNAGDILRETEKKALEQFGGKVQLKLTDKIVNGELYVDQGVIAGCSGGMYDNIAEAAAILDGCSVGDGYFSLSVYPPSVPVNLRLIRSGVQQKLMEAGALFKSCFCGPCFGAGDVPSNNGLSIRHTTRNFPNREGSKPGDGQLAAVVLMDARSIAATARNGGRLTAATEIDYTQPADAPYEFDGSVYEKRVYSGFGKPDPTAELRFGPNIADWPAIPSLSENLVMELAAVIHDPVTTTDELIPSGETSSYRSNPMKLASFALSRREPQYVKRTEKIRESEAKRASGDYSDLKALISGGVSEDEIRNSSVCSVIFANRPGDGSAREQAASCQRVLGGGANICYEYATKRYRSNCINWGMLPFVIDEGVEFDYAPGDIVYVPDVRGKVERGEREFPAKIFAKDGSVTPITLKLGALTDDERDIILRGCLMNHYAAQRRK
jgi:aconitate hydratase